MVEQETEEVQEGTTAAPEATETTEVPAQNQEDADLRLPQNPDDTQDIRFSPEVTAEQLPVVEEQSVGGGAEGAEGDEADDETDDDLAEYRDV